MNAQSLKEAHPFVACEITATEEQSQFVGTLTYRGNENGQLSGHTVDSVRSQFQVIRDLLDQQGCMLRRGTIMLGYHNDVLKGDVLLLDGEIIGERGILFFEDIVKIDGVDSEIEAIAKDKYPTPFATLSGWTDEGIKRASPTERAKLESNKKFIVQYAQSFDETFANVFALCLTEPEKAEQLAPQITGLIMKLVQQDENVRDVLTKLEVWELGSGRHQRSFKAFEESRSPQGPQRVR